jgi:hypothetical protein
MQSVVFISGRYVGVVLGISQDRELGVCIARPSSISADVPFRFSRIPLIDWNQLVNRDPKNLKPILGGDIKEF